MWSPEAVGADPVGASPHLLLKKCLLYIKYCIKRLSESRWVEGRSRPPVPAHPSRVGRSLSPFSLALWTWKVRDESSTRVNRMPRDGAQGARSAHPHPRRSGAS